MSNLSTLRATRREYRDKITTAQNSIRTTEDDYDALAEFKRIVERSQEAFHSVNSGKDGILEDVAAVKRNSQAAQNYYNGMKDILGGIGSKLVAGAYFILVNAIKLKLTSYTNSIDRLEGQIEGYQARIRELDREIAEAEALAAAETDF